MENNSKENEIGTFNIRLGFDETTMEMPQEIRDFFCKLKQEHSKKIPSDMLIEQFNIRVNMHFTHATIETTTSSYDKSKHYLSYLK